MSDHIGSEYTSARGISDSLFTHGCLLGSYPLSDTGLNSNPVFETQRLASRFYRVMRRQELLSYEVDESGARLRFTRHVDGYDAWDGIAPPAAAIESGALLIGETYEVLGSTGTVTHAGEEYAIGQEFTATGATYTATGDAGPWVVDGIRHTALAKGWTNEWLIVLQTHAFKDEYDSIWKPSVYADHYGFCEPALFMLPSADVELTQHCNTTTAFSVDPGDGNGTWEQELTRAQFLNPEAPSSYRYAFGANSAASTEFKKSRPVYEKPMEIWSCTLEFDGSTQIVVVHLRERPRYHANAPATVDVDPTAWSADDLARLDGTHSTYPEDYRTPDNALREYLRWEYGDASNPSLKVGDHAYSASPYPVPWGNVIPMFHLVKLIPEAYEDDNDTLDSTDTRILAETHQQCEWYLRCMCEGFVSGATSIERTCENAGDAGLYDWTWPTINFAAHGGRDVSAFPESVREDRPAGFGPLPNTKLYADTHNRLCAIANLLTKLRMDVPLSWSIRDLDYIGNTDPDLDPGTFGTCTDSTFEVWVDDAQPPTASTLVADSGWYDPGWPWVGQGTQIMDLRCPYGGGTDWTVANVRRDTQWFVEIDPTWLDAVPEELQDLVAAGLTGTVAVKQSYAHHHDRVDDSPRTECDGVPGSWRWDQTIDIDNVIECVEISPGTLNATPPPVGDIGAHTPIAAGARCDYTSEYSITWAPIGTTWAYVAVPLADLT